MTLSLRKHLENLQRKNDLLMVRRPVDAKFELGALVNKFKGTRPIFFEHVQGYSQPVVAGLCGDRRRVAETLGVRVDELIPRYIEAISSPLPSRLVSGGPVQETVITRGIDIPKLFPVPTFHEKDSAPFITAGVLIVKDPVGGRRYTSIRRMQVNGGNRLSILIESPGLFQMYRDFEAQNRPLEVAVMLGVHPIITLASQLSTQHFGLDKMDLAGALAGQPVELVRCQTVDLEVPAEAEIVLEGRMLPKVRYKEGPFGELAGYYGPASEQPVVEISAVTHRKDPIFQTIFPSSFEHKLPNALMREVVLFLHVRHIVPDVKAVHLTMAGSGRFHAIVSIKKKYEGEGKSAIMAALASNKDVKHVVVVDDDVDIFDPFEVEWAIASRVQADQDVVIIPGARGNGLDPSNNLRGYSAKMGIDATYPLSAAEVFKRPVIPGNDRMRLEDYLEGDW